MNRILEPARPRVETQWLAPRCARVALLVLPFVLLLCCQLQLPGVLHTFGRVLGGLTLIVVPGYILLWVLGLDPLAADAPGYRWPLVVPLSLAIGVLLGTFLVLTPIGLSACSLWGGLSVLAAMSFLGGRWL